MTLAFKIALLATGILFAMVGLENNDKDCKAANITMALGAFILLWLTLMTM